MTIALRIACTLAVSGLLAPCAVVAQAAAAPSVAARAAAQCQVWARELSFARSVADHDAAAFAEHVHADAVFGPSRPQPARGRDAVVSQWAALIDGNGVRLAWYPAQVVVAGTGDHAWSTGPALYEDPSPTAKQRFRLGQFSSVWRRDADGVWRVLFDDGIAPQAASQQQADAFHAGRREACPGV